MSLDSTQQSIINSLDGEDAELYPFLPYLLQDFWELGTPSSVIIELIRKNSVQTKFSPLKVLDLGCGKGAVSIPLARKFNAQVIGIDALPEFIDEAKRKAKEFQVEEMVEFRVGDIRELISFYSEFHFVILNSIGPVLGDVGETLTKVSRCLISRGYVIIDDGFIPDEVDFTHPDCLKEKEYYEKITKSGFVIIDSKEYQSEEIKVSNEYMYSLIVDRADELSLKFPDKRNLFEGYLKNQRDENYYLENKIKCITLLLQKKD
ncbi:MAG: methyltransferase domain-containing protein [Bacteroidetes bacterium]|nr:methyltransferase domain-containing protein [Bacteroidota bacterium]